MLLKTRDRYGKLPRVTATHIRRHDRPGGPAECSPRRQPWGEQGQPPDPSAPKGRQRLLAGVPLVVRNPVSPKRRRDDVTQQVGGRGPSFVAERHVVCGVFAEKRKAVRSRSTKMTSRMRSLKTVSFLVFLLACTSLLWAQEAPVNIWEAPLVLPTYETGPADLEPMFYAGRDYQGAQGAIYPYGLYDNLLDVRNDKTYQADFLENQYVKICVLPELGGRI